MTRSVVALQGTDVPSSFMEMEKFALMLANSKLMPNHLRGDEASVFSVMLAAKSLNIPMWAATQQIAVQKGRTTMSSSLMQSLVIRAGFNLFVSESGPTGATIRAERPGIGKDQCGYAYVTFDVDDALRAKLLRKNTQTGALVARSDADNPLPWELYTEDMFIWRAIARGARRYFPDVLMGMNYTAEELGGAVNEDGEFSGRVTIVDEQPDEKVVDLSLRIAGADSRAELRPLFTEAKRRGVLDATVGGVSIQERLDLRLRDLPDDRIVETVDATGDDVEIVDKAGEQIVAEPAVEPEPADVETEQLENEEPAATDVEVDGAEEPADDDGWDAMLAEAESSVEKLGAPAQPDPEEERADTGRRRGVIKALLDLFVKGHMDADEIMQSRFGLRMTEVSTTRLQDLLMELTAHA